MIVLLEFVPEHSRPLPPMSARKSEELARHEVSRMRRHDIEEACFFFGVSEGFQSVEMGCGDVHSVRISPVMSWLSRTRRKRGASSTWLYKEKPAFAFSARPCGR